MNPNTDTNTNTNPITLLEEPVATEPNAIDEVEQVTQPATSSTSDIRRKLTLIEEELRSEIKERDEVIHGMVNCLVAKQHGLMVGPGGTGKSLLTRELSSRITDPTGAPLYNPYDKSAKFNGYVEIAFDESTEPDQVLGGPNIKKLVDEGKMSRQVSGTLADPTTFIGYLDEFFNGPKVTLHSVMPLLNERIHHNNGIPTPLNLWSVFMTTNKVNADIDLAALWDRVHQRWDVGFVKSRASLAEIVKSSLARQVSSWAPPARTYITTDEIRQAHDEAMRIPVTKEAAELFFNIKEALLAEGVIVSDRRTVQGMVACLANAYQRGKSELTEGDLDILSGMWWVRLDEQSLAAQIVLAATNPGEKKAMDLMDDLDKVKAEVDEVNNDHTDKMKRTAQAMESYRACQNIVTQVADLRRKAEAAGSSTGRIQQVEEMASSLMTVIQKDLLGLSSPEVLRLKDDSTT